MRREEMAQTADTVTPAQTCLRWVAYLPISMGSKRGECWPPGALSGHQRRTVWKSPNPHRAWRPQDGSGPHSAKATVRCRGIPGLVIPPGARLWLFFLSLGIWRDVRTPDALGTDFEIILSQSLERKRTVTTTFFLGCAFRPTCHHYAILG